MAKKLPWFNREEIYSVIKESIENKLNKPFLHLFSPIYKDFDLSIEEIVNLHKEGLLENSVLSSIFTDCFSTDDIFFLKLIESTYLLSIKKNKQALLDLEHIAKIYQLENR